MGEPQHSADLRGETPQHPLSEYVRRLRAVLKAEGQKDFVIIMDRAKHSAATPGLHGKRPDAAWFTPTEQTCYVDGDMECGCCPPANSPIEQFASPSVAGEQSAGPIAPVGLGDNPEDWMGSLSIEVKLPGDDKPKTVRVFGLTFGNEYCEATVVYLIAAESQRVVEAYFADLITRARAEIRRKSPTYIFVSDSAGIPRPKMDWDDVVLQPAHRDTIERNIEAFFKAKKAYHKHRLAYRRGLLMVGPPGNGKSSVLKILASRRRDVSFFMYGFAAQGNDPQRLKRLFAKASEFSPSIVVLEDIDRVAKDDTMRVVLNILDGITSSDGVFVLATSNNAGDIDPALIERPSRFDLVLRFGNPDLKQRQDYLAKKLAQLGGPEQIEKVSRDTEGFSMAMLQELFAGALLESVLSDREPTWADLEVSHKRLKESLSTAKKETGKSSGKPTGFLLC